MRAAKPGAAATSSSSTSGSGGTVSLPPSKTPLSTAASSRLPGAEPGRALCGRGTPGRLSRARARATSSGSRPAVAADGAGVSLGPRAAGARPEEPLCCAGGGGTGGWAWASRSSRIAPRISIMKEAIVPSSLATRTRSASACAPAARPPAVRMAGGRSRGGVGGIVCGPARSSPSSTSGAVAQSSSPRNPSESARARSPPASNQFRLCWPNSWIGASVAAE